MKNPEAPIIILKEKLSNHEDSNNLVPGQIFGGKWQNSWSINSEKGLEQFRVMGIQYFVDDQNKFELCDFKFDNINLSRRF